MRTAKAAIRQVDPGIEWLNAEVLIPAGMSIAALVILAVTVALFTRLSVAHSTIAEGGQPGIFE